MEEARNTTSLCPLCGVVWCWVCGAVIVGDDDEHEDGESTVFAAWGVTDLMREYDCTPTQARRWLKEHKGELELVAILAVWDYIDENSGFQVKDDEEVYDV